jgi:hypothetical protein
MAAWPPAAAASLAAAASPAGYRIASLSSSRHTVSAAACTRKTGRRCCRSFRTSALRSSHGQYYHCCGWPMQRSHNCRGGCLATCHIDSTPTAAAVLATPLQAHQIRHALLVACSMPEYPRKCRRASARFVPATDQALISVDNYLSMPHYNRHALASTCTPYKQLATPLLKIGSHTDVHLCLH